MAIGEDTVQCLLDRTAIRDVQLRYATGVDTRDWPLFRSCFTDEIETESSSAVGSPPQRIQADDWVERVRRTIEGLQGHATHDHQSGHYAGGR